MAEPAYLQNLTATLLDGLELLPAGQRDRHADWLRANQNPDGGFSGRDGPSDLYYTGFALRGLAVLAGLTEGVCQQAAGFLKTQLNRTASVVDLFSLLVGQSLVQLGGASALDGAPADWPERVVAALETCRTPDGGYAKGPGQIQGSTYHAFLVVLALQMLNQTPPEAERLIAFIRQRGRPDGGFAEAAAMTRCGANPTAAGLGTLQILGALDDATRARAIPFLLNLQAELDGGFRANGRVPAGDLLSTFTVGWSLFQLHAGTSHLHAIRDFALACERNTGGFTAGLWDQTPDVEYTFYGLGVLSVAAHSTTPLET
jgi:geranylgeranyl transferase type-2 subunit beta